MTQQNGSGDSVPIPIDRLFPILPTFLGGMIDNGFVSFRRRHASANAPEGLEMTILEISPRLATWRRRTDIPLLLLTVGSLPLLLLEVVANRLAAFN